MDLDHVLNQPQSSPVQSTPAQSSIRTMTHPATAIQFQPSFQNSLETRAHPFCMPSAVKWGEENMAQCQMGRERTTYLGRKKKKRGLKPEHKRGLRCGCESVLDAQRYVSKKKEEKKKKQLTGSIYYGATTADLQQVHEPCRIHVSRVRVICANGGPTPSRHDH